MQRGFMADTYEPQIQSINRFDRHNAVLARKQETAEIEGALRSAINLSLKQGLHVEELIHILSQEIMHWTGVLVVDGLESQ
jgi:hypothetical protein